MTKFSDPPTGNRHPTITVRRRCLSFGLARLSVRARVRQHRRRDGRKRCRHQHRPGPSSRGPARAVVRREALAGRHRRHSPRGGARAHPHPALRLHPGLRRRPDARRRAAHRQRHAQRQGDLLRLQGRRRQLLEPGCPGQPALRRARPDGILRRCRLRRIPRRRRPEGHRPGARSWTSARSASPATSTCPARRSPGSPTRSRASFRSPTARWSTRRCPDHSPSGSRRARRSGGSPSASATTATRCGPSRSGRVTAAPGSRPPGRTTTTG